MTTAYKYHYHYTGITPPSPYITYKIAMMRAICDTLAALPGVTVKQPYSSYESGGSLYSYETFCLTGNEKDQFAITSISSTLFWGLCGNGIDFTNVHLPDFYLQLDSNEYISSSDYDFDVYFIVKDGKLVTIAHPFCGRFIFHYTSDDLYTLATRSTWRFGRTLQGNDLSDASVQYDVLIQHSKNQWIGRLLNTQYINATSGWAVPSGKMCKMITLYSDKRDFISALPSDYPINMFGGNIPISYQQAPTFTKIQIDNQKYIHVGGTLWIPYDTYTEQTINVGD